MTRFKFTQSLLKNDKTGDNEMKWFKKRKQDEIVAYNRLTGEAITEKEWEKERNRIFKGSKKNERRRNTREALGEP